MTNILFVSSSPRGEASLSNKVAERVLADLVAHEPTATVVRRDLAGQPLPHIDGAFLGSVFTPASDRSDEQAKIVSTSDALVDELLAADVVIIASAMINFTIPSTLKAWLDHVARAGRTFNYVNGAPVGLVTGKHVVLVEAKGGIYSAGPMLPHDHQQPYLLFMLGFLGMTDIDVIPVEGVVMGPDIAGPAISKAESQAAETARSIAVKRAA